MELKIGTPVLLVTKGIDGKFMYSPSQGAYYYLGKKVIGSFYGHPYHKILPTFKIRKESYPQYLVPARVAFTNEMEFIENYAIDKIVDTDTLDTTPIEYYQSIREEIEEYYNQ